MSRRPVPGLSWLRDARSGPARPGWTHARSYAGWSPTNLVHRARLSRVGGLVRGLGLPPVGRVVDLGCSDGFVLAELRRRGDLPAGWRLAGYDRDPRLLRAARARSLSDAAFRRADLNDSDAAIVSAGDLVLCLETLEHVGNPRAALEVVHVATRRGGWILLSLPNEVGLIGLVKLVGRPLLRRHAYDDFFTDRRSRLRYAWAVATYQDLSTFRSPARDGWGPHLGFDHRRVSEHVRARFEVSGDWTVVRRTSSGLAANHLLLARRER